MANKLPCSDLDLEDLVTCSICEEIYKDPIALQCLHTLCKLCVEGLRRQSKDKNLIQCPNCRKQSKTRMLQKDFKVQNLLDHFHSNKKSVFSCRLPCGLCDNDGVDWVCNDCDKIVCSSCKKTHSNIPSCANHTLTSLDGLIKVKVTTLQGLRQELQEAQQRMQLTLGEYEEQLRKIKENEAQHVNHIQSNKAIIYSLVDQHCGKIEQEINDHSKEQQAKINDKMQQCRKIDHELRNQMKVISNAISRNDHNLFTLADAMADTATEALHHVKPRMASLMVDPTIDNKLRLKVAEDFPELKTSLEQVLCVEVSSYSRMFNKTDTTNSDDGTTECISTINDHLLEQYKTETCLNLTERATCMACTVKLCSIFLVRDVCNTSICAFTPDKKIIIYDSEACLQQVQTLPTNATHIAALANGQGIVFLSESWLWLASIGVNPRFYYLKQGSFASLTTRGQHVFYLDIKTGYVMQGKVQDAKLKATEPVCTLEDPVNITMGDSMILTDTHLCYANVKLNQIKIIHLSNLGAIHIVNSTTAYQLNKPKLNAVTETGRVLVKNQSDSSEIYLLDPSNALIITNIREHGALMTDCTTAAIEDITFDDKTKTLWTVEMVKAGDSSQYTFCRYNRITKEERVLKRNLVILFVLLLIMFGLMTQNILYFLVFMVVGTLLIEYLFKQFPV